MLSRLNLILERHGQAYGQTDRFAISISHVSVLTRDKKRNIFWKFLFYNFWQFFSVAEISRPLGISISFHFLRF